MPRFWSQLTKCHSLNLTKQQGGVGSFEMQYSNMTQVFSPALHLNFAGNVSITSCNVTVNQTGGQRNLSADFPVLTFDSNVVLSHQTKQFSSSMHNHVAIDNSNFNIINVTSFTSVIKSNKTSFLSNCSLDLNSFVFDQFFLLVGDNSLDFGDFEINAELIIPDIIAVVNRGSGKLKPQLSGNLSCPPSYMGEGFGDVLSCWQHCTKASEYSFERGFIRVRDGNKDKHHQHIPECKACPVGAFCEGKMVAAPNYWGFKDDSGLVTMIRCPTGYCCQGNKACQDIDSCNTGRTGTLCGSCEPGLTQTFFFLKCIPEEDCLDWHFAIVFVIFIILAPLFFMFKDKIGEVLIWANSFLDLKIIRKFAL